MCGCGVPDTDSDGDGALDCSDQCPSDPGKTAPGVCGCGVPDTDSDGDGAPDCSDQCPNDPAKTAPGVCGCGVPDTDADGDGTPDCGDQCPSDPGKTAPGVCGCGVPDTDSDGDGTPDCTTAGGGALPITIVGLGLMEHSLSLADLPLLVVAESSLSAQNAPTTYELTFYEGAVSAQSLASSGWGRDVTIERDPVQKEKTYFVAVKAIGGGGTVHLSYKIVPPGMVGLAVGQLNPALLIGMMLVVLVLAGGGWWMVRKKEAELAEEEAIEETVELDGTTIIKEIETGLEEDTTSEET